jgi:hypothetical protein
MLAAPGVSRVSSDVPRSKSDRVRVENVRCRSIRVTANGADDVRTAFWRTTGLALAIELKHQWLVTWLVVSALWICFALTSAFTFRHEWQQSRPIVEGIAMGSVVLVPTLTIIPVTIWILSRATASMIRRR